MMNIFKAKCVSLFIAILLVLVTVCGCTINSNFFSRDTTDILNKDEGEFKEQEVNISEVVLGPGDEIEISVWRNSDLNGKYKIDSSGKIFMPLIGVLDTKGVGVTDLREEVVKGLSEYLVDPQVKLVVTSYQSRKVYILGEVSRPGIFPMEEGMSMVEAVAMAGGFTKDANSKSVLLVRGELESRNVKAFNLTEFLEEGDNKHNAVLNSGDIVYVASSFIANVDRFFGHLEIILRPLWRLERMIVLEPGVEQTFGGGGDSGGNRNTTVFVSGSEE